MKKLLVVQRYIFSFSENIVSVSKSAPNCLQRTKKKKNADFLLGGTLFN